MKKIYKAIYLVVIFTSVLIGFRKQPAQNIATISKSLPHPTVSFLLSATVRPTITALSENRQQPVALTPVITKTISLQAEIFIPSSTPVPIPTSTVVPIKAFENVNVEIKAGGSSASFTIETTDSMDVCSIMEKAKDEGKINSLTMDDSYLSTLNSKYVKEINGYKDNWTFTVNGNSPLGCSLYTVKPNDLIIWKFL